MKRIIVAVMMCISSTAFALDLHLVTGWNLMANTTDQQIDVQDTFGSVAEIEAVWKWTINPVNFAGQWQAFFPSILSTGYAPLVTLASGTGFWIKATMPATVQVQASGEFYFDAQNFKALRRNSWHLIGTASPVDPNTFNTSDINPLPPSPGVVPVGAFDSLWAWDATAQNWLLYIPLIQAQSGAAGMQQAAQSNGYLDFMEESRALGPGVGFWVRK